MPMADESAGAAKRNPESCGKGATRPLHGIILVPVESAAAASFDPASQLQQPQHLQSERPEPTMNPKSPMARTGFESPDGAYARTMRPYGS